MDRQILIDAFTAYVALRGTVGTSDLAPRVKALRDLATISHSHYEDSDAQYLNTLEDDVRNVVLAIVAKREGAEAAATLADHFLRAFDTGGVTVRVSNTEDPFTIMFEVSDEVAHAWADHDQCIDGDSWETPGDMSDFAYAMGMWYPGVFEKLEAEGYCLDFSDWSDPDDLDVAIAKEIDYHENDWASGAALWAKAEITRLATESVSEGTALTLDAARWRSVHSGTELWARLDKCRAILGWREADALWDETRKGGAK